MKKNKKLLLIIGIAAVLLIGLMFLLIFLPKSGSDDTATIDEGIAMEATTDSNGVHQVKIETDENGNIKNNSYGTLMDYVPAKISTIHVENTKGTLDIKSETPTDDDGNSETTTYTIVGFEDYALQSGAPDEIASCAASIEFKKVASLKEEDSAEFGFDEPRSTVTVNYTDNTKAVITVGDDAPQSAGTYIKFGDGDAIYLVESTAVSAFDYGLTDLMSLTINTSASDSSNSQASSISLSGSAFSDEIVLEPYTGDNVSASYRMTKPVECYANESECSKVDGAIRGLYAESVKMVNPSESQLSELGLAEPYAEVKAVYPDTTVDVLSSKPDSDGKVNVMLGGGNVVYVMASANLPWVSTSYEKLFSEYVLYPKMTSLSEISINNGDNTYDFELTSKEVTTTDDSGNETTSTNTTVKYQDKEIAIEDFSTFYDDLTLVKLADVKAENASGSPALSVTYKYSSDDSTDTVKYYLSDGERYVAEVNGTVAGHSQKAVINNLITAVAELVK